MRVFTGRNGNAEIGKGSRMQNDEWNGNAAVSGGGGFSAVDRQRNADRPYETGITYGLDVSQGSRMEEMS